MATPRALTGFYALASRTSARQVRPLYRALAVQRCSISTFSPPSRAVPQDRQKPTVTRQWKRNSTTTPNAAPTASQGLKKTPLYDLHQAYGAKFVPFAGYAMAVQYSDQGVGESHKWTREKASLFDVSHMVQHIITGPDAPSFLELVTPGSIKALKPGSSTLSCLLHPKTGGIVDDTIITRLLDTKKTGEPSFYVVTNGATRDKVLAYISAQLKQFQEQKGGAVRHKTLDGYGLVALQGPLAAEIMESVVADPAEANVKGLYFGQSKAINFTIPGRKGPKAFTVSRGGYTGEDGFEISIDPPDVQALTEYLLEKAGPEKLRLAGLGARDSLRLEAGMCLYGHDLDDTTTPAEAALGWVVGKERREGGGFHGAEVILPQLKPKKDGGTGVTRRRVGLVVEGAPAREGAKIVASEGGEDIGTITSGCPSPTVGKNIAMGYIKQGMHKSGTEVGVVVRGRTRKATVTKMPFVPSKYWKAPA